MFDDSDMKIVGAKPTESVKNNMAASADSLTPDEVESAKRLGLIIAEKFLSESDTISAADSEDSQMVLQRKLLLSFTISVSLDKYCKNDSISGIAEKSFLDKIKSISQELYLSCCDTGAFSFYYLAYRRNDDVERRIGQTFAMLCSHDGDPIFQELGETLFCWFSSVVKSSTEKLNLQK
jgi:hypothetical protein